MSEYGNCLHFDASMELQERQQDAATAGYVSAYKRLVPGDGGEPSAGPSPLPSPPPPPPPPSGGSGGGKDVEAQSLGAGSWERPVEVPSLPFLSARVTVSGEPWG